MLNDYPVASDKIKIKKELLSSYPLKIADFYNILIGSIKTLVANFFDKENYMVNYKNLQLYLKPGLNLKKIHRILQFNQSKWLKAFVELNTQKRTETENNGDKDGKALYTLMNNAFYNKVIENLRNKIDVRLVSKKKDYVKYTSKQTIFHR